MIVEAVEDHIQTSNFIIIVLLLPVRVCLCENVLFKRQRPTITEKS